MEKALWIETPSGVVKVKTTDKDYEHFRAVYGLDEKMDFCDVCEAERENVKVLPPDNVGVCDDCYNDWQFEFGGDIK